MSESSDDTSTPGAGHHDVAYFVARRLLWGVFVVVLVISLTWVFISLKPQRAGPMMIEAGAIQGDSPTEILSKYFNFVVDYFTLNWGESTTYGKPVVDVWADRAPITLVYLVPALLVSAFGGIGLATYGAMKPGGWVDRFVSILAYIGVSLPTFVLAEAVLVIGLEQFGIIRVYNTDYGVFHQANLTRLMVPAGLLALSLLGVVSRYARNESLGYLGEEFVKVARAKGAGRLRLAAHVFRNAWLALMTLLFTEFIGLIFLGTIVLEVALQIPGIAAAVFEAFQAPDPMLVLSAALVAVVTGVLGTLFQDFARLWVDPRSETEAGTTE